MSSRSQVFLLRKLAGTSGSEAGAGRVGREGRRSGPSYARAVWPFEQAAPTLMYAVSNEAVSGAAHWARSEPGAAAEAKPWSESFHSEEISRLAALVHSLKRMQIFAEWVACLKCWLVRSHALDLVGLAGISLMSLGLKISLS